MFTPWTNLHAVVGFLLHMMPWFFARLTDKNIQESKKVGIGHGDLLAMGCLCVLWRCYCLCLYTPPPPPPTCPLPCPPLLVSMWVTVSAFSPWCQPEQFEFPQDFCAWKLFCSEFDFDAWNQFALNMSFDASRSFCLAISCNQYFAWDLDAWKQWYASASPLMLENHDMLQYPLQCLKIMICFSIPSNAWKSWYASLSPPMLENHDMLQYPLQCLKIMICFIIPSNAWKSCPAAS